MALSGGLRDRMLVESVTQAIVSELTTVGWFGSSRQHSPVIVQTVYPADDEEPEPNTLVVSMGNYFGDMSELGSKSEERFTTMYVDFFGESRSVSTEIMGDIWAFLRENPVLPVYDYSTVGSPIDFYVELDEDSMDFSFPEAGRPWQKHYAVIRFGVWDYRANG